MSNKSSSNKSSKRTVVTTAPKGFPFWTIAVPLVLLLAVAIIWIFIVLIGGNDGTNKEAPNTNSSSSPTSGADPSDEIPKNSTRPTGNIDSHRKDLTNKTTALLRQAKELASDKNLNENLVAIAKGDESDLPKDFVKKFRFTDKVKDDKEIRAAALISVLQLGQVLDRSLPEGKKIELLNETAWKYTYVDLVAGNAFVPLSLYLGQNAAFSFEYVWVDGKWQFAPYSFIDGVSSAEIASKSARDLTFK